MTNDKMKVEKRKSERLHVVIYGYSRQDISKLMNHFREQLPEDVGLSFVTSNLVTHFTLHGEGDQMELLRFKMNRYRQNLVEMFSEELVTTENKTVPQVLGQSLLEKELTVSSAESCTGGNIAHRIVQEPGSSAYFLGSVVSYSNEVKSEVLGVSRASIDRFGAVSRQVVEEMVAGVCKLMHSQCGIATSGIAGPDGGSQYKPVGTVWIAVKYRDTVISECVKFSGDRNEVIESATNHGMVMLINLLRDSYIMPEDFNDE